MKSWGPYPNNNTDILIYSIGALDEGHGPALSRQTDDIFAIQTATNIFKQTGFPYRFHLPYVSDRMGEIAKDWCPPWMPPEETIQRVAEDIKADIATWRKPVSYVVIISGHGGNNFLKREEKKLAYSVGVPALYIEPFSHAMISEKYDQFIITHADKGEHSVAAYLGILDEKKLKMINDLAAEKPQKALEKWKPIAGLGWYVLYGGIRYEPLRNPDFGLIQTAHRFLNEKKIVVDNDLGQDLFETNVRAAVDQITKFTSDWP